MRRSSLRKWLLGSLVAGAMAAGTTENIHAAGATIANSRGDFGGVQGGSGWSYGYFNFTANGGDGYQTSDFIPFGTVHPPVGGNAFSFRPYATNNHGGWDLHNTAGTAVNPFWTAIGTTTNPEESHPNGTNQTAPNNIEQWAVRRYVAETTGNFDLAWHLRKTPTGGTGVSGHVFLNGVQIDTAAIAGPDTFGVHKMLNLNLVAGDVLDFAHSPVGNTGDRADGSDTAVLGMNLQMTNVMKIADSRADWSTVPVQGANNWTYGYYNKTADGDATYAAGDFLAFDPGTQFVGGAYDLSAGAPWTFVGKEDVHPNGTNNVNEHWAIRRYSAEAAGDLLVEWDMAKVNRSGSGISGAVYLNGVLVDSAALHGGDHMGRQRGVVIPNVNVGDFIDIAIAPTGASGATDDGSDGSKFGANIYKILPQSNPAPMVKVADSVAEFSGSQGSDNWIYGYWDKGNDADKIYDPNEMIFFDDGFFQGGKWDLAVSAAPWVEVNNTGGHPSGNGTTVPNVHHWAVRRWVSEVDGDVRIAGIARHVTTAGQDGTIARIFIDGVEVWSGHVHNADRAYDILASVSAGSYVDFVIDAGLANLDGSDSTFFTGMVFQVIPEPTSALALLGLGVAGLIRRRRA